MVMGLGLTLAASAAQAQAQAPAAGGDPRDAAIMQGQQRTGAAYRDLQQAEYDAKLAGQDVLNAQDAAAAARRLAEERAAYLEEARKALAAAQAKVAAARKRYEEALSGVDKAFALPPAKK